MSFAAPLALLWALLAIPIVVFYVLKIRLRQEPVSTTLFWNRIYDEKSPRSIWRRLRHWVSLLLQILLLAMLVLALASPYFLWEILQPRRIVLVIDDSASMRAEDVEPSRLDLAKQMALAEISGMRFRDEMAVVAAGTQPRVLCGLTGHERTLREAVDQVEPTDGVTAVAEAVELGRRLLADAPHGKIVVLSDGRFQDAEKLAKDEAVDFRTLGTPAGNVALTRFQVRRSLVDPIGYVILAEVANLSDESAERRLEIDLGDSPVDVFPLRLAPGETWSKTIEKVSVDGGHLVARLSGEDALAVDDVASAILPHRRRQRVVLVSEENLFLRMALAANPLVDLERITEPPASYDDDALYVFHRVVPEVALPRQAFFLDPREATDFWTVGGELADPIVVEQDEDSPLMQHVRLDNVVLPKARSLKPTGKAQTLAEAVSGDPLFFAVEERGRTALVLTVNLDEGDLTFRTAFPILVTNALGWFAGESGELQRALACGEVADVQLVDGDANADDGAASRFAVVSPTGAVDLLPNGSTTASLGPLDTCGIWRVVKVPVAEDAAEAGDEKLVEAANAPTAEVVTELAVNLASAQESDLRVPSELTNAGSPTVLSAGFAGWLNRPLWFWLAAMAFGLCVAEWFLYQRRWIG
ncbi:MAG TPA: VWA domain-containing protein [Pirellulaceae bacterium]|jgi:hypothetical protein|nr:VWA domain-containing protein [Pirellulaceae bacterium]